MRPPANQCLTVDLDNFHSEEAKSWIKQLLSVGVAGVCFTLKLLVKKHHIPGYNAENNCVMFYVQLQGNSSPELLDTELDLIYSLVYRDLRQRLLYH